MKVRERKTALGRKLARLKIRYKVIASIYIILFPMLIAVATITGVSSYKTTMTETTQNYQRFVQLACDEIDYLQQDALDVSTYFSINTDVVNVLSSRPGSIAEDSLVWSKQASLKFIQDIFTMKSQMKTLILYPANGLSPFYISHDTSVHNTDFAAVSALELHKMAYEAGGDVVWRRLDQTENGPFISNRSDKILLCRVVFDLSKQRELGFLVIGMDASRHAAICANMLQQPNEGMIVLSRTGEEFVRAGEVDEGVLAELTSGGRLAELRASGEGYYRLSDHYVFCAESPVTGATVCYLSPSGNWVQPVRESLTLPIMLGLALLLCAWPLSIILSRAITRPTEALCDSMEKFRSGDFSQQIEVVSEDEIGQISSAFNQMVNDIHSLIDRNYVMALRERESELDALQAQINPHFLYNVLDSLYWQAMDAGSEELSEHVLALANIFRLLLSQGQSEIPVQKEIELIKYYLQIQSMRFSNRLTCEIDIDPAIMSCRINKLTLQPFVENAIVHGCEKTDSRALVRVTGRRVGDRLVFRIEDNGVGMPQEVADQILLGDADKQYSSQRIGGYAIRNIKERLAICYGEAFVLRIESAVGKGTCVTVAVPVKGEEKA